MTINIKKYLIIFAMVSFFIWAGLICYKSIPMCINDVLSALFKGKIKNTMITFSIFLALCGGCGIIQYLGRRFQNLFKLELFFVAGIFSLIIFFSKTFIDIAIFVWIIALSYALGFRVLRMLSDEYQAPSLEAFVFSTAIGLGAFSIGTFLVGLAGLLYELFIYGILAALTIVFRNDINGLYSAIKLFLSKMSSDKQDKGVFTTAVMLILLLFGVMNFIGALGPEIMYDSLVYHLTCPKMYVDSHKIAEMAHEFRSYWPENMEMFFTLGLLLKGQILAKLFHFFFGILTAIGIYCLCREFYSSRTGLLASAFFYTCPTIAWESTTTYIDLGLSFYCFLAFYACLKFISSRKMHWLIICGILLGLGFGVKLYAVFTFIAVLLVICFYVFYSRMGINKSIKIISLFCIITFLIALPWYLRTYILTGNPIFPLFNSIFQSPFWLKNNEVFNQADYGMGKSFLDYLKLPWNVTFHGNRFGGNWESGITFLMFVPLFLWKKIAERNLWQGEKQVGAYCNTPLQHPISALSIGKLLFFYALIYSLFWTFSAQMFRYYIPILPVISIICASPIDYFRNLFKNKWIVLNVLLSSLVLLALCANIPFSLSQFWNIPTRIPYKVVFGLESRDDYLSSVLPDYKTIKYINDNLNPDVKIFSLVDHNSFYCERPLIRNQNPFFMSEFSRATKDRNELLSFLKKETFTHILINRQDGETGWYEPLLSTKDLHLLHSHGNVYLYKILSPKERIIKMVKERHDKNLLKNSSFEKHSGNNMIEYWRQYGTPRLDCTRKKSHSGDCAVLASSIKGYVQSVFVEPSKTYTLSHYSRIDNDGAHGRVQINWIDGDGKGIDASIYVFPAKTNYEKNSLSATAPENAIMAEIYVSSHENHEVWYDDFSFVKEMDLKAR